MSMKHITESVTYPFSIGLPIGVKSFLEYESIDFTRFDTQIIVRFENKTRLMKHLRTLNNSNNPTAKIIFDGICRSI